MFDALVSSLSWWQWAALASVGVLIAIPAIRNAVWRFFGWDTMDEGVETILIRAVLWLGLTFMLFMAFDIGQLVFDGSYIMSLACVVIVLATASAFALGFRYRDDGKTWMSRVFFTAWALSFVVVVAGSQTVGKTKLAYTDASVERSGALNQLDLGSISGATAAIDARTAGAQASIDAAKARVSTLQRELDARTAAASVSSDTPTGLKAMQDRLGALGYDTGGVDAVVGEKTRSAARDNARRIEDLSRDLAVAQRDVSIAARSLSDAGAGQAEKIDEAKSSLKQRLESEDIRLSTEDKFSGLAALMTFLTFGLVMVTPQAAAVFYVTAVPFIVELMVTFASAALYHGVDSTVTHKRRDAWADMTSRLDGTADELRADLRAMEVEMAALKAQQESAQTAELPPEVAAEVTNRISAIAAEQAAVKAKLADVEQQRVEFEARIQTIQRTVGDLQAARDRRAAVNGRDGQAWPPRPTMDAREIGDKIAKGE